jgi:hypothetical protein
MQALDYAKRQGGAGRFFYFFDDANVNIRTPEVRKLFRGLHREYLKLSR